MRSAICASLSQNAEKIVERFFPRANPLRDHAQRGSCASSRGGGGRRGNGSGWGGRRGQRRFALVKFCCDVIIHQRLKRGGKFVVGAFERLEMLAIDVHRAARCFS